MNPDFYKTLSAIELFVYVIHNRQLPSGVVCVHQLPSTSTCVPSLFDDTEESLLILVKTTTKNKQRVHIKCLGSLAVVTNDFSKEVGDNLNSIDQLLNWAPFRENQSHVMYDRQ